MPQGESDTVESPSGDGEDTQPTVDKQKNRGSSAGTLLDQESASELDNQVIILITMNSSSR